MKKQRTLLGKNERSTNPLYQAHQHQRHWHLRYGHWNAILQYLSHFLILGWQSTSVSAHHFKDLDDDIDMESDALEEWLITPVIRLERGNDVVA